MKVNFKRMFTVLAVAAMCAAPATSVMSASAAVTPEIKADISLKKSQKTDLYLADMRIGRVDLGDIVPYLVDFTINDKTVNGYHYDDDYDDWCGNSIHLPKKKKPAELLMERLKSLKVKGPEFQGSLADRLIGKRGSDGTTIFINPLTNPPMMTVIDSDGNKIYHGPVGGYPGGILGGIFNPGLKTPLDTHTFEYAGSRKDYSPLDDAILVESNVLTRNQAVERDFAEIASAALLDSNIADFRHGADLNTKAASIRNFEK